MGERAMVAEDEMEAWAASFEAFLARFGGLFWRSEAREQAGKYLRGLLAPVERKNGWQVAEMMGDMTPDRMQRLLYQANWDADAARDRLQAYVIESFGEAEGIGVLDETGFLKKGKHSVGVARQYSGTAGKVENCQIGTFLSYATDKGHVFLDRRLYLPEVWCADPERREQAKVPEGVVFATKPEQAVAMLEQAWAQGVPMRWVTGDEVYGDAPALRAAVAARGCGYVLAVSSTTPVWRERPAVAAPQPQTGGRPQTKQRLAKDALAATTVAKVVASWPAEQWQRFSVGEGEKGPRLYDWARARVVESRQRLPGPAVWLLARRSIADPSELAFYLALAADEVPLSKLAQVAATRYTIEQCFEEAKGETGLDHYEVRHWQSWHRHITLSMMAHAWLAAIRSQAKGQKGGDTQVSSAHRTGSAPATGHSPTFKTKHDQYAIGLVHLAPQQTFPGARKPFPPPHPRLSSTT
jgi:SRSO17 transposase